MSIRRIVMACALALAWSAAQTASAQTYPSRPIRIINPLGVTTPADISARAIAARLSQVFGVAVTVENRAGANGIIAMEACAKAAADGYTLCVPSFGQMSFNPVVHKSLPYDPVRDFEPVIQIGLITSSISVHPSIPVKTLKELVELAKAKPGTLNWASWGVGSFSHLNLVWLEGASGAIFTHVPYKTIEQTTTATITGEAQVYMNTPGLVAPFAKQGKLRVLAIVGRKRSPLLPEVPLVNEQGFTADLESWVGMVAPAGTPRAIVQRLNAEIDKVLADPEFVEKTLAPISVEAVGGTPEAFRHFMKESMERTARVARAAGLKQE